MSGRTYNWGAEEDDDNIVLNLDFRKRVEVSMFDRLVRASIA